MSTDEKAPENTTTKELRIGKPRSPFAADPFNKRGGKGGGKFGAADSAIKGKKLTVKAPKRSGGSGGDR